MKHHLLTAIIMALSLVPISSHAYDFSAVNDDGVTIYYNILSDEEKTCEVTYKEKIQEAAFSPYKGNIIIPDVANGYIVKKIGDDAFSHCEETLDVILPNSITTIGDWAFGSCPGLKSISIPWSLNYIERSAFLVCSNLERIVVSSANPYYNSDNDCNAIIETKTKKLIVGCKNTKIPDTVTTIGEFAFDMCIGLTSIAIPNSVTYIEDSAFLGCFDLEEITFGNSLITIGNGAFYSCHKLKNIFFSNSVQRIEDGAFADCKSINSLFFPNSLQHIGNSAFIDCSELKEIALPSSVKSIDEYAFSNCIALEKVTSQITDVFSISENVFDNCGNAKLFVPTGLKSVYQSAGGWIVLNIVEKEYISLTLACNHKGSLSFNEGPTVSGIIEEVSVLGNEDNTFTFAPKPGCRLDQVTLNGLDITANVEGNTLTCTIPANSQMIVTFASEQGDMNNDGTLDISDVVAIVNKILGN